MKQRQAEYIARTSIVHRRKQVLKYWLDAATNHDIETMLYWVEIIMELNDAHTYFTYGESK